VSVLVLFLGLHWALLQAVAWTGMLINYSRDASLTEAVTQTFDGEHPCKLCNAIKQGRAEEKKQEQRQPKSVSKLDVGLVWQAAPFIFESERERIAGLDSLAFSRSDGPPKPRPRGILPGNGAEA
jgi:hypothetical protein